MQNRVKANANNIFSCAHILQAVYGCWKHEQEAAASCAFVEDISPLLSSIIKQVAIFSKVNLEFLSMNPSHVNDMLVNLQIQDLQ